MRGSGLSMSERNGRGERGVASEDSLQGENELFELRLILFRWSKNTKREGDQVKEQEGKRRRRIFSIIVIPRTHTHERVKESEEEGNNEANGKVEREEGQRIY